MLEFSGVKVTTLLDTGAARSVLDKEVFVDICQRTGRAPICNPTHSLHSVTGQELQLVGETEVLETNLGRLRLVVAERLRPYCILGSDLLTEGKAVIDYINQSLLYQGKQVPLFKSRDFDGISELTDPPGSPWEAVLAEQNDLFTGKDDPVGFCDWAEFKMDTTGPPIHQRPYRAPLTKRKLIEEEIDRMLAAGIIRPSCSPWSSPVTLVPKKDGGTRFCVDFRKVNEITKKERYPLTLISDIFDQLTGATIFSTLDLFSGFFQLPVSERDIEKTAFVCHVGQFEFTRMPFGVANGPSTFQRLMNKVLSGLLGHCAMVYLDDIVVFSKTPEEHAIHLKAVFDCLRKAGLTLKRSKCTFGAREVELLGFVVSKDGIKPNPDKVKAIIDMASPTDIKGVRRIMGMAGYYRSCLPHFAHITEPLVRLTRKGQPFIWGEEQERALDQLKQLLTSNAVMAYPQIDKPYKLFTDASNHAVGAILVQEDDSGTERVIQYISHQLSGSQLRWSTVEKEAYALVYSLGKLRPYLYGAEFTVYTDHKPLTSLFTAQLNNTKIQRWAVLLAEFGAKVQYRKGANNIRADMLSRIRPSEMATIDTDTWFDADVSQPSERIPALLVDLDHATIGKEQQETMTTLFEEASNTESDYEIHNGLLYSVRLPHKYAAAYPRLVAPPSMRAVIMEKAHIDVGHMSTYKTLERVREAYVWPKMRADIRLFCFKCPVCSVHTRQREHVEMGEMPIPAHPMQIISADITGPLAKTDNDNQYILNIIDHLSGWAESYALPDKTNENVWKCFRGDFFPRHGFPECLITDNGREFTARAFQAYLTGVGVKQITTTVYHPCSNGRSERFNKSLKAMLTKLINGQRGNWDKELPNALMAYRNSVSSVTGHTPFHLMYGRRGRLPLTRMLQPPSEEHVRPFGSRLDELAQALDAARVETENSRKYNRERLARKANAQKLEMGDTVIVAANEPLSLTAKWDHQYEVIRIEGTTHWVRHQTSGKTIKVHRDKLRLVDPEIVWDEVLPRPKRTRAKLRADAPVFVPTNNDPVPDPIPEPPTEPSPSSGDLEPDSVTMETNAHAPETATQDVQTEALGYTDTAQQTGAVPRTLVKRHAEAGQHLPEKQQRRHKYFLRPSIRGPKRYTQEEFEVDEPEKKLRLATLHSHLCWNCLSPEHYKRDCPTWGIVCWHCKKVGHYQRSCPQLVEPTEAAPDEEVVARGFFHTEDGSTGTTWEVRVPKD